MENATTFDLNLAIQHWREDFAASPVFRDGDLDELEFHLRDSVASLQARELSAEEAFWVAAKRVGSGGGLEAEFAKVNRPAVWLDRMLWMLIGIQLWGCVAGFLNAVARSALCLVFTGSGYDYSAHGQVIPVALSVLFQLAGLGASLAVCWWLVVRRGQSPGQGIERLFQHRIPLAATGGVLFMVLLAAAASSVGLTLLLAKLSHPLALGEFHRATAYSNLILLPIQVAVLLALTLFLVRTRFSMQRT